MRIVFFSKAMITAAYRDRVRALSAHCDVRLVIPATWPGTRIESLPPAEHEQVLTLPVLLGGHNHLHLYRHAAALLDRLRPGLVHIDEEPYSAVTWQLGRLCRRRHLPFVFFAWQNLTKRLPPPFTSLRARVFAMAAGGIAGTPAAARVLREAGCNRPLAVIPQMGVPASLLRRDPRERGEVRARLGVQPGEQLVGFGGRLVPEKGVDVLLGAAALLPGVRVLVLGDGPERGSLEQLARFLGISDRVYFAGHVGSLELPHWLTALDALVLPSRTTTGWTEQFGRILVEAMACGVPVIGSRSGEIPHVIGPAGLLVPEGNARALAAAVAALGRDPGRCASLVTAGRQRVREHYTNTTIAAATAAFYRDLLTQCSSRAQHAAAGAHP